MKLLNPPNVNSFKLFKNIVLDKELNRRNQLTAIQNDIKTLYKNYWNNRCNLENISASKYVNPDKENLLHCYNSDTKSLDKLKSIIGNNPPDEIKNRCLYCLIGNSTSLDHYLPKEDFPEFAVNIFNLFPCCGTCNSKKGTNWLIGSRRRFINFGSCLAEK